MDIQELKKTGTIHDGFITEWLFFGKAFRAGRDFITEALIKHPSETDANFDLRLAEAFNFPYAQNIVTIYNHFLTEKPAIREVDKSVSDRDDWRKFQKNCDLYETPFESYLSEAQKLSGAYGVIGILVDYPTGDVPKDKAVAPYLSCYTPNNILDWEFDRDPLTGIPKLTYLKLKESARYYLIWRPETWEKYRLSVDGETIEEEFTGENPLGEIPFVFFQNIKDTIYPYLGVSDIADASYVNAAIIRAFSMGNEALKFAGFPMLTYPYPRENAFLEDSDVEDEIVVNESTVLQYDPDARHGRPAWLESPVKPSIEAVLAWVDRLTEEAYRAANLSGLHESRAKAQAKSGVYLRYQFQQSNSVLSKKADTLIEAEKRIYRFWNMWCEAEKDQEVFEDKVKVSRIKEFSIDSLQVELQNMLDAMAGVMSNTFKRKMQVRIAKYTYPDLTDSDVGILNTEIEKSLDAGDAVEHEPDFTDNAPAVSSN